MSSSPNDLSHLESSPAQETKQYGDTGQQRHGRSGAITAGYLFVTDVLPLVLYLLWRALSHVYPNLYLCPSCSMQQNRPSPRARNHLHARFRTSG